MSQLENLNYFDSILEKTNEIINSKEIFFSLDYVKANFRGRFFTSITFAVGVAAAIHALGLAIFSMFKCNSSKAKKYAVKSFSIACTSLAALVATFSFTRLLSFVSSNNNASNSSRIPVRRPANSAKTLSDDPSTPLNQFLELANIPFTRYHRS